MKKHCKSGCMKNKIYMKKKLEGCMEKNPYAIMLYKCNTNLFNKFYKDTTKNKFDHHKNYHKNHTEIYEEFNEVNEPYEDDIDDNTGIFPASWHDTCNYHARKSMASYQLQAIMRLDGRLDFERLKKAAKLLVNAEPVLRCRFVEDDRPYLKRIDNVDETAFCDMEETDYTDRAVNDFLENSLDMDSGPMIKAKLVRSEKNDVLCLKVNHVYCDGTDTKRYIRLLSDIYSHIDKDDDAFLAEAALNEIEDQDELFEESETEFITTGSNPVPEPSQSTWIFPWTQRNGGSVRYAVCRIPRKNLYELNEYAKRRGASLHDIILTAFYRAMFRVSRPLYGVPMDISTTVDLRKYLPGDRAKAARNLTGGFISKISRAMNEPFEKTLYRVMNATREAKDRLPVINSIMGHDRSENYKLNYNHNYFKLMSQAQEAAAQRSDHNGSVCLPSLSDLGYVSESQIRFGSNSVTDAYLLPPVMRTPGMLIFSSAYNDILTLSIGYCKDSVNQQDLEDLLYKIKNELTREIEYESWL